MKLFILLGAIFKLLLAASPLFLLLGFCTALGYVLYGDFGEGMAWLEVPFGESMRKLTDKPPLLAIPFFVLSGSIMSRGAIATRLSSSRGRAQKTARPPPTRRRVWGWPSSVVSANPEVGTYSWSVQTRLERTRSSGSKR